MFLKNKNIIFKIRRSKVTDYAALIETPSFSPWYIIYGQAYHEALSIKKSKMIVMMKQDKIIEARTSHAKT